MTTGGRVEPLQAVMEAVGRHKFLAVALLLASLGGASVVAAGEEPTFTSYVTIVVVQEREAVIALLASERLADRVAETVAPSAVLSTSAVERAGGIVVVSTTAGDAATAERAGGAYLSALAESRVSLENVTRARVWKEYYDRARNDTAQATKAVDDYLAVFEYYEVLDGPTRADRSASVWGEFLVAGGGLGVVAAIAVPTALDAWNVGRRRNVGGKP